MRAQHFVSSLLSLVLVVTLGASSEVWAQSTPQTSPAQPEPKTTPQQTAPVRPQPSPAAGQPSATGQQPPQGGATVNPSQPPLQPVQPVTTYPDAQGNQQQPNAPQPKTQAGQAQGEQPTGEPQGAATAERVPTAGGAAAKPAGVAIAPPKQHQTRSLLIKLGAVVAGAAAAGTIYALSRGTPSTPPGANGPGAIQKSSGRR
jgi:cytoskeletal protein RodZ